MIIIRELSPFRIGDFSQSEPSITAEPPSIIYEDKMNTEEKKMHTAGRYKFGSGDNPVKHILDLMRDFDTEIEYPMQETNAVNKNIRRIVCTIKEIEKNLDTARGTLGW